MKKAKKICCFRCGKMYESLNFDSDFEDNIRETIRKKLNVKKVDLISMIKKTIDTFLIENKDIILDTYLDVVIKNLDTEATKEDLDLLKEIFVDEMIIVVSFSLSGWNTDVYNFIEDSLQKYIRNKIIDLLKENFKSM